MAEGLLVRLRELVGPVAEQRGGGELAAARRHRGEAAVAHRDAQLPLLAAVRHAPQGPQTLGGEQIEDKMTNNFSTIHTTSNLVSCIQYAWHVVRQSALDVRLFAHNQSRKGGRTFYG